MTSRAIICWLIVALKLLCFNNLFCTFSSQPLVSFGELTEVVLTDHSLRTIYAIEEDVLHPGGFVIANQHSVAVISPNLTVEILAGKSTFSAISSL